MLRLNLIPAAHQISADKRGMRDLMRARLRLVHKKTSCLNSIHRLLEKFNLSIPNNRPLHEPATLELLNDLPFESEYRLQLDLLKEQVVLLNRQIKALEKALHPLLIPNPDIQRLLHIPGVGKVLAFTEAGFQAIRYYKEINQFYQRNARKKHNNIARILVAKELAKICFSRAQRKNRFQQYLQRDKTKPGKIATMATPGKPGRLTVLIISERCY